jgi:hypothetical protein
MEYPEKTNDLPQVNDKLYHIMLELGFFSFIALRTAQNLTLNTMKNLILETLFDTKKSRPLDSLAWYRHFNKQWWG